MRFLQTVEDLNGGGAAETSEEGGIDAIWDLNTSLSERLTHLVAEIRQQPGLHPIVRLSIARYDAAADRLDSYVSAGSANPLEHYSGSLADFPDISRALSSGLAFVNNHVRPVQGDRDHPDTRLFHAECRSQYALPIRLDRRPFGLAFFSANQPGFFTEETVAQITPYCILLNHLVASEVGRVQSLLATALVARQISHYRDDETGNHLDRMSAYSRLIARRLAPELGVSDEYIELIRLFAPLHDLGKIAIPDSILRKPGKLTPEEWSVMQTHVVRGVEIVDHIAAAHLVRTSPHAQLLRNIVAYHHEAPDGSGYPYAVAGDALPWESRIVTVADVFDALTSRRPYKLAWSNEDAVALLRGGAGSRFDPRCVEALVDSMDAIVIVQHALQDRT